MSDRRGFRLATTSARLIAGALASVGAVALVATAASLPWPTLQRAPAAVEAIPGAAATTIACAGDLLSLGRDVENPGAILSAASLSVTAEVLAGAPAPESRRLSAPDTGGAGAAVFTVAPQGNTRTDVAASGSAAVFEEDLAGFAASACRPPLIESWLVGGSGATGAADLVLLANPGTVAATVQLTVYGAGGAQNPPGGADIVVPAGAQRAVPLAGLALSEEAPVVRVTATGAPVQAALQASITRTLVPGGIDQVSPVSAPDTTQIVAGVDVTQAPGAEGGSGPTTIARILSPGVEAQATVTVTSVGGSVALAPLTVPLGAGIPTEVDLGGLPVGRYVVEIAAETPVVAAVWQTTGFGAGADFAWYAPAPQVDEPSLFAVPAGAPARVTFINPGTEAVDAVISTTSGDEVVRVPVAPGSSTDAALPRGAVYLLDTGGGAVRAAVSQAGDSALAGFPVWPADAAAPAVVVYP